MIAWYNVLITKQESRTAPKRAGRKNDMKKEVTLNGILSKLVDDYNNYSELVALNYQQGKEKRGSDYSEHTDGTLQWNRGHLDRIQDYMEELASLTETPLVWEYGEHDFGADDWKRKLSYKTVKIAV